MKRAAFAAAILALFGACRGRGADPAEKEADAAAEKRPATPVRVAPVEPATIAEIVSAPGQIVAMSQAKVRAPFAGTLTDLRVTDGDPVSAGQAIGTIVSRDSEAALSGAVEMERQAATAAERRDAERALALARKNLVRTSLLAAAGGVVASHAASAGDRVTEGEEIVSIAEARSLVLRADVAQTQLAKVRAGQTAAVEIVGRPPLEGRVHDVLPDGGGSDLTVPVRIDFDALPRSLSVGLFATARITVAEHRDVASVPDAAVLRDDVTGKSRMALVGSDGKARWVDVIPGLSQNGKTEILAPRLPPGSRAIVAGQVGLPDGAPVAAGP